jgi:hypothetical protein
MAAGSGVEGLKRRATRVVQASLRDLIPSAPFATRDAAPLAHQFELFSAAAALSVIDNVLVVHHLDASVATLLDVCSSQPERLQPLTHPLPLGAVAPEAEVTPDGCSHGLFVFLGGGRGGWRGSKIWRSACTCWRTGGLWNEIGRTLERWRYVASTSSKDPT